MPTDHALNNGDQMVKAWSRWRRARQAYVDERGTTLMDAFGCVSRGVRWRDG
ncbi:hypothetical protein [Streptomyces flavidovirens]